ncbi:microtubule associated protein [Diplocarpon rosae]|nr:microtubule associated protein [Diplocarpon rosae]
MEVEEGQREIALPASEERPQTARRDYHSRTIPEGFDSLDGLSPSKEELGHSILEDAKAHNAKAHESNNKAPSLDHATLPSLPPPGESSLLYSQSEHAQMGSDALQDTVDEGAMQRYLNDVESSFMPVPSPISMDGKKGADDSYLFDGAQAPQDQRRSADLAMTPTKPSPESQAPDTPISPPTPADAYKTPGVSRDDTSSFDESIDAGNTTSSLETLSSSPTAAAAARTVSRAILSADVGGNIPSSDVGERSSQEQTYDEIDTNSTPKKNKKRKKEEQDSVSAGSSDDRSTLREDPSNRSIDSSFGDAGHAGNTPGLALLHRRSSGRRPRFLRSRHASQNSSVSSFITNEESQDGSDITVGADYALQSGGAVPADGFSRSSSMGLSRTISLGSMASGIEDFSGNGPDGSLATLTEEEQNRDRISEGPPPATPRAPIPRSSIAAPSDTVIARHVRNVQVPASVAQEYRNKNGVSPKRSGLSVSTLGRNSKNLTLKEQSSTIERLSKENFDLKLKVMFLSDRLDKLSEEGVKEMISENVELKTGLAVIQRDNKALKRKLRELEKLQKDDEERPSTAETLRGDPSPQWSDQEGAQEREEELLYLRERIEEYVTEIEKMRNDAMVRENDKRNLAEVVRQMGERRGQNVEAREEMDVWKDLLEQETSRREQADDENRKLREEIFRLKTETTTGVPGLNHTTNIYNITKKRNVSPSRPRSGMSEYPDERSGTVSSATTLVDDLKRESDQLRHENAELRREVGAQTSMLTSRNREKERLYQEIEDLKLGQRRNCGGSVTGDSILERSASRAHERSSSRTSVGTRQKSMDDNEREDFENKHAELRDRINSLKIQNQDLQRELESCMKDFETAVEQKKEVELEANELQEALEMAENDVVAMQTERDDALRGQEETEIDFENLRKEAQAELDHYQLEVETATSEIGRLQSELADTTENFNELQNQMRVMSESMLRLEDGHESKGRRIEELERELEEVNREQEQMENNLVEANGKINRLGVQQESSQNEIAFLREEQDGDKIKIGDLEAALKNSEDALHDERERVKELEDLISAERHQREVVAGKEKQEVQQFINELNRECSNAKDEARRLRKSLSSQEVEAAEWKQRLMELESNLREALGDLNGTRSSLLHSIENLQRELERTMRDLDITKATLQEKERNLKIRDDLLESNSLETRKLADIVDKERQAHRLTKHQFETFQKTQQHNTRTLTQQELRVLELETSRHQDRQKILRLENNFKDQMLERNQLLLALWNRLSAICGSDWTHNNSLINGRALPSLEAVSTMLPGFSKNLVAAVKTIENLVGDFRSRIRAVEKDLWKEYQTLETNLELRTKRLDRLETVARSGIPSADVSSSSEISKLKAINRALQHELASLRTAHDVRSNTVDDPSPSPSVPTGPRNISDKSRTSTLTRHNTTSTIETIGRVASGRGSNSTGDKSIASSIKDDEHKQPDMRWQIRLRELEFKLMSEREGRLLDRGSMKERVSELTEEKEELLAQLEREKMRSALGR